MNITDLPNDIFLLIIWYLQPRDLISHRHVSKAFHNTLTQPDLNRLVLLQHYPRARELRYIDQSAHIHWATTFAKVASRYYHLEAGEPQRVEKHALGRSSVLPKWCAYYPVSHWDQHLQFEEKTAPFHYPDTLWTYSDGLLVFPSSPMRQYVLHDLDRGTFSVVEIDSETKIVRRISLKERVLVVEWCEDEPYHQLNENELVHRHFATAYDVKESAHGEWKTTFRNEWRTHFLGMPLNSRDRFFSTHTATHYALYLWQPNRSAWGEDEPIEALAVWDISSAFPYRPSNDPAKKFVPDDNLGGPRVIRRFSFADLDFYRVRQREAPSLRNLELDENHVYVVEEDHRWMQGMEASSNLPRLHKVKTVGIPFFTGPRWEDECGADGDVHLSYCERVETTDARGPGAAPCWRHEEFPYLTITEAVDLDAGVTFSARHCFMLETVSISFSHKVCTNGGRYEVSLRDDLWQQLLGKGKICGDERWLVGENMRQEIVILHFDPPVLDLCAVL